MPVLTSPVRRPGRPRLIRPVGDTTAPIPSAPATPSTPSPADASTSVYTSLSWVAAGATTYDVYLDTVTPPVARVGVHVVGASFVPTLQPLTTYYWQIVAINDGGSATGPIWSFTTPRATAVLVLLAGALVTASARFHSLSIHDVLGAAPNTATLVFNDGPPVVGQSIAIGLGTLDAAALLFAGELQSVGQSYFDLARNQFWPVQLIDRTFTINKRRPFGTWVTVSATTIAQDCVTVSAPGCTSHGVQANLPAVSINFDGTDDFMTCMNRLATAIGGRTKVDYSRDLRLFLVDPSVAPDPLDAAHPPLNAPSPLAFSTDLSQIRTRGYGKGASVTIPCVLAKGETIIPMADATMFTVGGGKAIAGTTSGGAQTQILSYAGVQLGGGGSLVGPGAAPSTAPTLALTLGSGLGAGWYGYAFVDATAAGKSLPSPIATILTNGAAAVSNPTGIGTFGTNWQNDTNSGFSGGVTYLYAFTFRRLSDGAETALGPTLTIGPTGNVTGYAFGITLAGCTAPPSGYVRQWYRTTNGGSTFKRIPVGTVVSTLGPPFNSGTEQPSAGYFIDHEADGNLGAVAPSSNGTGPQLQVTATAIALGASPTTSREVYRTAVQVTQAAALTAQLKLAGTIPDDTTTTYTDSLADGSLGANVPAGDTSGLTQPPGQVNAGSATLLTASAGPFPAGGGWVLTGNNQVVRYTGVSGNTLTGIPATGPGSIATTIIYGSQVLPAPALTGINANNGLAVAIALGSTVAIWVQRDDLAAQAALGLLELDDQGHPTDGIREYLITDERYNEAGLAALVDADLAQFSRPIVSVTYQTFDVKTGSGKTVHVDLPSLGILGDFVIQDVTITFDSQFVNPRVSVQASSVTFSLADLLRRVVLTR